MKDLVCKIHGPAPVAMACRHLIGGIACGFHTGPTGDAWCDRCAEQLASAGEWTTELKRQADIAMVCTYCYDLAAARNRDVPPLARGARAVLSGDEHRVLVAHATAHIAELQQTARARWEFDAYSRWDLDEDARTLAFTEKARPTLVADVRLVGAWSAKLGAFQWSWASHPAEHLLIAGVAQLRAFGEVRGLAPLVGRDWPCKQQVGWELTALAGYLLGCAGVYRAEFDDNFWFMLLSGWRHARRGRTSADGFGA